MVGTYDGGLLGFGLDGLQRFGYAPHLGCIKALHCTEAGKLATGATDNAAAQRTDGFEMKVKWKTSLEIGRELNGFSMIFMLKELFLGEVVRSGAWRGDGRAPGARGDLKRMCARLSAGRRVRRDVLGLAPHHGVQRWPGEGRSNQRESAIDLLDLSSI